MVGVSGGGGGWQRERSRGHRESEAGEHDRDAKPVPTPANRGLPLTYRGFSLGSGRVYASGRELGRVAPNPRSRVPGLWMCVCFDGRRNRTLLWISDSFRPAWMTRHRARRPSAWHRRAARRAGPTLSACAYVMPKCESDRGDVARLGLRCPLRMDPLVLAGRCDCSYGRLGAAQRESRRCATGLSRRGGSGSALDRLAEADALPQQRHDAPARTCLRRRPRRSPSGPASASCVHGDDPARRRSCSVHPRGVRPRVVGTALGRTRRERTARFDLAAGYRVRQLGAQAGR